MRRPVLKQKLPALYVYSSEHSYLYTQALNVSTFCVLFQLENCIIFVYFDVLCHMYSLMGKAICIFWRTLFFVYFHILRAYYGSLVKSSHVYQNSLSKYFITFPVSVLSSCVSRRCFLVNIKSAHQQN